jgi:hypothetical protein
MSTAISEDRRDEVPVSYAVVPLPVIEWTTVVKADDPLREATRGRLRELRKKLEMSEGIVVYRRGERGLEGRSTYHSVLSAMAVRTRREGEAESAQQLGSQASHLESMFAAQLSDFLSKNSLGQLPRADFFHELTTATARELGTWRGLADAVLAAARVEEIADDVAHLEGASPRGGPVIIDLPRALLDRQSVAVGDLVWVFRRVVGDAAIVELLPAVRIELTPDDRDRLPAWSLVLDGSDGLTSQERSDYAAEFKATVGGDLTADELTDLLRDVSAGRIVKRRLRPAG